VSLQNAPDRDQVKESRRRSELILIAAFWAFAVLMLSIRALIIDALPLAVLGPRRLFAAAFGALLCLAMARILAALRSRSFPARVVCGVVGAFIMAVTLTSVTMMLNRVILPLPGAQPITLEESAQWVLVWLGYLLAWTGTHLALTYHWDGEEHRQRAALLAELTRDAQRAALRYQLNPHFLFNTLNTVSSLVMDRRNDEAERMLLNLAAFIRTTLTDGPAGTIALSEEIALQKLYLEIEKVRFEERLAVEIDVPAYLGEVQVPALILQPLVENAIRHGAAASEAPLRLRIAAEAVGGRVRIRVEDDGRGGTPESRGSGLGLRNVEARLNAHFGEQANLEAGPLAQGGYRASLSIPESDG
jgi:two-component system LytT family sensor kinase